MAKSLFYKPLAILIIEESYLQRFFHTLSNFLVEKLLVEEISTNKELAKPYMDESHTPLIMDLVNAPDYSGNPKDLKAKLPEDITYSEIKATLASVACLLYTSPSPRDGLLSRMPSSA